MDVKGTPSLTLLPTEASGVEMVAKFFRALADPARLRLLEFLLHEEHTVSECVDHIGLS
ncbi:MAG: ArsR/SmtB family transcription factor [Micromonosporaceae bacterium]